MPVDEPALRPWTPACVPPELLEDTDRLSYVLVDEIVGETVTLAVAPWPGSDELGRVRFPARAGAPAGHVLVHLEELRQRLYEGWMRRSPRIGDAFAAVLGDAVTGQLGSDEHEVVLDDTLRLADTFPGDVADLTAEARTVAKLAFYAAVAGVQPHDTAEALGQVPRDGPGPGPRVGRVRPEPWPGPFLGRPAGSADGATRWTVPKSHWPAPGEGDLVAAMRDNPTALFYFLLNIGDGDSQLLVLPQETDRPRRRAMVVDAGTTDKLLGLMTDLGHEELLPRAGGADQVCALVVATHPHDDHIEGLAELVETYGHGGIGDFWEPGYYAPTRAFAELMAAVEDARLPHCEPTAGMVRYVGGLKITVLAPSVRLRTAYDTLGVDCNDASIVLKVGFPAVRISTATVANHQKRRDLKLGDPWSIILGADAQTRSWSNVTTEFEQLHRGHDAETYRTLRKAAGRDHLAAHILKVSHHASKHGINIELIERMHPRISLISSVGGGGRYGFPHALATQAIAEALFPTTRAGTEPRPDAELGIHYTGGLTDDGRALGSIALMVPAKVGAKLRMWRFGDGPRDRLDLARARLLDPVYRSRRARRPARVPAGSST
jgi:beta-lactamase superfamily II metal-dependent hydrolase